MLFAVFDHNDATGLPAARQLDERLELITAYERLGYYAYQLAEHHGTPLGIATPHLMLAAASRLTSTIRLGTMISILPLVPPLRMVEEVATLDQLTGGRLVLGVGRGISPVETGFHGVPGDEAQPRFDEAFEILQMGLDPAVSEVTFHGKYYDIDSAPVVTKTVQQPFVPWYATATPDKARWCARLGMPMLALVPSPRSACSPTPTERNGRRSAAPRRTCRRSASPGRSCIADTNEKAMEIASRAFGPFAENISYLWKKFDVPMPPGVADGTFESQADAAPLRRRPGRRRAWVAEHARAAGVNYFSLEFAFGDMT